MGLCPAQAAKHLGDSRWASERRRKNCLMCLPGTNGRDGRDQLHFGAYLRLWSNKRWRDQLWKAFYAEVGKLGDLPDSEVGQVCLAKDLPEKLTYPDIQPHLYQWTTRYLAREGTGEEKVG